jgi:tRNA pseudouridine55 synthase
MNGIVIVDKPQGWTSQDVTARLRRVFQTRRIGHGGTLDPMATGVLPVFVGRATRGVEFFEHARKEYVTRLRPGIVTDTQDMTGTILEEHAVQLDDEKIEDALSQFRGEILQIPPMYSAIKVNGQKLYDLARKGKTVEREPRPVTIFDLTYLGMEDGCIRLRVSCSKGTYIRTLCHDIGAKLGCGGCMESLRRTRAGEYDISQAVPLQQLLESASPEQFLQPVDSMFRQYPAVTLTSNQETRCRNGNSFSVQFPNGTYRAYARDGSFLMLAEVTNGLMTTIKSFFEVE